MWRFWLYRTTEPDGEAPEEVDWRALGIDDMTRVDLSQAPDDATVLWRHHHHWMRTGRPPRPSGGRHRNPNGLAAQMYETGEAAETNRIGAAYKLASSGDDSALRLLGEALVDERESVRRAATYGLVALGSEAADVFLDATESAVKWVRKAGVYGLGDVAPLTAQVLDAVADRLANDPSVYVRSVAANALGCLGRRAVASGIGQVLVPQCVNALVESLGREENRLGMNIAQDRSIKFVRPTDECDVCEGIGINYSTERFKRVRSAVRENALTSMVVLCSHGAALLGEELEPTVSALADVVRTDENVFSVGLALDSLSRLANVGQDCGTGIRETLLGLLKDMPIHSWEPLVRSGLDPSVVREFSQAEIERP